VNVWLVTAALLIVSVGACAPVCLRGNPMQRLVALELAANIDVLILLLLAQGFNRDAYLDLSVALALLSLAGGLVFAHVMERWV
jgi:multisubunit Na+/H+ antiporter MnhF subunit